MSEKSGLGYSLGVGVELSNLMLKDGLRDLTGTPKYNAGDEIRSSSDIVMEGIVTTGLNLLANALNIK